MPLILQTQQQYYQRPLDEVIKARKKGGLLDIVETLIYQQILVPIKTPSNKAAWHTEGDAVETES